nr:ABC transporter substrate-binding protein [Spirulina subsalsa]
MMALLTFRTMGKWRRFWVMLLLGAIAFSGILSGCRSLFVSQAAQVPQLVLSILSDPKTFNAVLSAESPNIFGLTYDGLVRENPITGEIEPVLAESWDYSDDQLSLTFTLKENLKWSDGEPLTVDDVVFTYNQLYLNEDIPSNARDSLRVGQDQVLPEVEKVDERRVRFSVVEPFAPFLANTGLPILPAHALRESVEQKDSSGRPLFMSKWGIDTPPEEIVFNGPYVLKNYTTSQRVIFEKNPFYWDTKPTGEQKPFIERVVWQIVESTDTSFLQFRSGSLDSISVAPDFYSLLKREEERGKFTIYNGGPAYGTSFITFNLNQGSRNGRPLVDPIRSRWFNNVKFRQAVAYGIDRQRMINNLYRGLGRKQNSPISIQSPFHDDSLIGYDYNPERAKELLLEAGFQYNEAGQLLDDQGNLVRWSLITNAGNKIREAMASQIKQDLEQLGMQIDYAPLAFNVLVDRLSNSLQWECCLLGLTGGNEPNDGANVWFPEGNLHMFNQKPQAGREPIEGWQVADWENRIADLYIAGARELDFDRRKAIYVESQQITNEYLPFIYLVNPLSLSAVRDRIQGIEFSALGGAFWDLPNLTIASE